MTALSDETLWGRWPWRPVGVATTKAFDPDEPRDSHGRWTTNGIDETPQPKHDPSYFTNDVFKSISEKAYPDGKAPTLARDDLIEGNKFLQGVMREQGFLEKPTLLKPKEFAKYVKETNPTLIYRGIGSMAPTIDENGVLNVQKWYDEYTHGDTPRIGFGVGGDGQYFTTDKILAESYAKYNFDSSYGRVYEGCLKPDAKVLDSLDLKLKVGDDENFSLEGVVGADDSYTSALSTWAVVNGYDAIKMGASDDTYVVLNRGALVLNDNGGKMNG
jgi:hypothetical protein